MVEGQSVDETREPVVFNDEATKEDIRQKMWEYIEKHDLADVPRPVFNRIPNFKGRNAAAEHLTSLEFFQKANTVKINPDKPQEWARFLSLEAKKDLLVPTPRLRGGLFNRIIPSGQEKDTLKMCATTQGIRKFSKPVGLDAKVKVDMIVSGSVAVSKRGYRIGKGEGFADLEYAMMRTMGAASEDTLVITTVHDCQVVDIPESLMEDHDFMVDYILTPTQVIKCDTNRAQPSGVIWSKLSPRKVSQIPILKELREQERSDGKDVELRKPSSDSEEEEERRRRPGGRRQGRNRRYRRSRENGDEDDGNREKSLSVKYDFSKERREVSVRDGNGSDGESRPLRPSNRQSNGRRYRKTRYRGPRRRTDSVGSDGENTPRHYSDGENSHSDGDRRGGYDGRRDRRRERTSSSEDRPQRRYRYGYRNSRRQGGRYRGSSRRDDDFKPTVYIGNVPSSLRVSTFKAAVRERGVQPLAVLWKHGYAFLLMPDLDTARNAVDTLLDIEFEGVGVKVELSRLSQEKETTPHGDHKDHEDLKGSRPQKEDGSREEDVKFKKEGEKPGYDKNITIKEEKGSEVAST